MDRLSRFHNKPQRIRNGSRYFRNSTIRNCLKMYLLPHRIKFLSKRFHGYIYKISNDIVYEIPDYDVYSHSKRKRPRYTNVLGE